MGFKKGLNTLPKVLPKRNFNGNRMATLATGKKIEVLPMLQIKFKSATVLATRKPLKIKAFLYYVANVAIFYI